MNRMKKWMLVFLISVVLIQCKKTEPIIPKEEITDEPVIDIFEDCTFEYSFAVIELFTSEGCNTCPVADQFLEVLIEEYADSNILFIAEHVDYWNTTYACGGTWIDQYSIGPYVDNTTRQTDYSLKFGLPGLITPQFVFNGQTYTYGQSGTVLYNGNAMRTEINNQYAQTGSVAVCLVKGDLSFESDSFIVHYKVEGDYSNTEINLVLLESSIEVDVFKGENCGKTLHHDNVVRSFNTFELENNEGAFTIKYADDVVETNCSVSAFINKSDNKEVIGATKGFKLY